MKKESINFEGFPANPKKGDFWMYPAVMDQYWQCLNGFEQKVLDFILRHTWGFKKINDRISLSQLKDGVGKMDKGTGITKPTIIKSIKGLIEKGIIEKSRKKKGNEYNLVVKKIYQYSKENELIASKDNLYTINNITIDNNTINKGYFSSDKKLKPFYMGEEMRKKNGVWMIIPKDGGSWCEYTDKEEKIEWK